MTNVTFSSWNRNASIRVRHAPATPPSCANGPEGAGSDAPSDSLCHDGPVTQILGQYCINVSDIDKAIEFWVDVCELELQHRTEIPGVLEAVIQSPHGGSRLQLAQHLDHEGPIDMGSAMWKIYINTSDCERVYARAMAAGCESVQEPTTLDRWPVTIAFVKDFDGYLIEFVEHHEGTRPGVPDPKKVA